MVPPVVVPLPPVPVPASGGLSAHLAGPTSGAVLLGHVLEWVKRAMNVQLIEENSAICDLYCGTSTEMWADSKVGRYLGIDSSASAIASAQDEWERKGMPFPAEFQELDPCLAGLHAKLDFCPQFDAVSCHGHLQDCFLSEETVQNFLANAAALLKPGGFLFGTCPDSSTIWCKYQKVVELALRQGWQPHPGAPLPRVKSDKLSAAYAISFENDKFATFGTEFHLKLDDGMPPQKHLMIHFPSLIRYAEAVGLEYIEISNLEDFYEDNKEAFASLLLKETDMAKRIAPFFKDLVGLHAAFVFRKAGRPEPQRASSLEVAEAPAATATGEVPAELQLELLEEPSGPTDSAAEAETPTPSGRSEHEIEEMRKRRLKRVREAAKKGGLASLGKTPPPEEDPPPQEPLPAAAAAPEEESPGGEVKEEVQRGKEEAGAPDSGQQGWLEGGGGGVIASYKRARGKKIGKASSRAKEASVLGGSSGGTDSGVGGGGKGEQESSAPEAGGGQVKEAVQEGGTEEKKKKKVGRRPSGQKEMEALWASLPLTGGVEMKRQRGGRRG